MKKHILNFSILLSVISCNSQEPNNDLIAIKESKTERFYIDNKGDTESSISEGSVSKGILKHGKLIPFKGDNFKYFDSLNYFNDRGFVNDKVKNIILNTYSRLNKEHPSRKFQIMECSNKKGGKMYPHRTHQNGLSVDFMIPLLKNDTAYYGLDNLGVSHYLLDFNNNGEYLKDTSIKIDFNMAAKHLLILNKEAKKNNYYVKKVLIKTELIDNLFSTPNGEKLKKCGVYIARKLPPLINSLHDDHYHVDFGKL